MRRRKMALAIGFLLWWASSVTASELQEETLSSWNLYVSLTEARIEKELASTEGFLIRDFLDPGEASTIASGVRSGVVVRNLSTRSQEGNPIEIEGGLVHHWYGTVFVPGARVDDVVAWEQDYDRHHEYYEEVEDSRLLSREGGVFDVFLRLRRKKVITVHYNTRHRVTYRKLSPERIASRSEATQIAEIENPGSTQEKEKPPGSDRGFLWRLNSYWRFQQQKDGVVVECESLSLSRTIPVAFRWIVKPFINSVPRESLEATLQPLRSTLAETGR